MRRLLILLLITAFESNTSSQVVVSDTINKGKIISVLKRMMVNCKCNANDSTTEKLYFFMLELRAASTACRKDSTCNKSDCILIMAETKISLRKKYGEDMYKAYRKLTECTSPFPGYPTLRSDSTMRRRKLTDQR
jgi:hypothetical protein